MPRLRRRRSGSERLLRGLSDAPVACQRNGSPFAHPLAFGTLGSRSGAAFKERHGKDLLHGRDVHPMQLSQQPASGTTPQ
jgi:hypothetical protein